MFRNKEQQKKIEKQVQKLTEKIVSDQDSQVFFDTVFSNTKPNQNLVAAAKRYKSKNAPQQRL